MNPAQLEGIKARYQGTGNDKQLLEAYQMGVEAQQMTNLQHLEYRLREAKTNKAQASNEGDYKAFEHWSKEADNISEMIKYWEEK